MSNRTVYVTACSGCAGAETHTLLKRAKRKDQSKVKKTNVGAYVARKGPGVARKINKTLKAAGKKTAAKVAKLYAEQLAKDAGPKRDVLAGIIADLDSDDLGEAIAGQLAGPMLAAFRRAAAIGAEQVGLEMEGDITKQLDKRAVAYAKDRGGELIKDLAGTTDDDMRSLLERAVSEGMSPDELSDAVQDMGAFGEARGNTIARTELAFAHVAGNKAGWAESGLDVKKKSILGDNHDIDDICDDAADAGVVDMDEAFVDDADDPPYHPNCICDILPVLPDPEDESDDDAEKSISLSTLLTAMRLAKVGARRAPLAALLRKNIDAAAHSAATSDLNLLRKPTAAQAKAGNYKKGHHTLIGLPLTIENPAGSHRRPQWPPLSAHYGYVRGTEGADGDEVDVFVRPSTPDDWTGDVYVVDQVDADGDFDEHKCMIGYDNEKQAVAAYAANYTAGWVVGFVTTMPVDDFVAWVKSPRALQALEPRE